MPFATVKVEVDLDELMSQLDSEQLAALGLVDEAQLDHEAEHTDWQPIADAIRRADFRKAEELIAEAAREAGVDLPPFAVARVA